MEIFFTRCAKARLCNRRETGVRRRYVRGQITGAYCNTVLVPTRLAVAPRGVGPHQSWALQSACCRACPGSSLGMIGQARRDHHEPITPTHRQCGLGARDFGAPTVDITCLTRPKVADDERCSDRRLSAPPNLKNFSCQSHPFFSVDRPLLCSRVVLCATRARVFLVPFITVSSEGARPAAAHVRIVESPKDTPADVNSTLVNRRANKPELVRDACERRFVCSREFDCANPGQTSCCTSRASPHTRAAIGFLARSAHQ